MLQITPTMLAERLQYAQRPSPLLLDVREPWKVQICQIPGSLTMPMGSVPARYAELERDRDTVVICHHGGRSWQVAMVLERQGFSDVANLSAGVAGCASAVDRNMPQY